MVADAHIGSHIATHGLGCVDVLYSKVLVGGFCQGTKHSGGLWVCQMSFGTCNVGLDYIPKRKATILRSVYMFSTLPVGSPEENIMADSGA